MKSKRALGEAPQAWFFQEKSPILSGDTKLFSLDYLYQHRKWDLLGPSTRHAGVEGPVLSRAIFAGTVLAQLEGPSSVLANKTEIMDLSSHRLTVGLIVFPSNSCPPRTSERDLI